MLPRKARKVSDFSFGKALTIRRLTLDHYGNLEENLDIKKKVTQKLPAMEVIYKLTAAAASLPLDRGTMLPPSVAKPSLIQSHSQVTHTHCLSLCHFGDSARCGQSRGGCSSCLPEGIPVAQAGRPGPWPAAASAG